MACSRHPLIYGKGRDGGYFRIQLWYRVAVRSCHCNPGPGNSNFQCERSAVNILSGPDCDERKANGLFRITTVWDCQLYSTTSASCHVTSTSPGYSFPGTSTSTYPVGSGFAFPLYPVVITAGEITGAFTSVAATQTTSVMPTSICKWEMNYSGSQNTNRSRSSSNNYIYHFHNNWYVLRCSDGCC
jgi:hypothetical protein